MVKHKNEDVFYNFLYQAIEYLIITLSLLLAYYLDFLSYPTVNLVSCITILKFPFLNWIYICILSKKK